MLKVAICGGSGYTGAELLRLLLRHPHVSVVAVTSERSRGKSVGDLFPHLRGITELSFRSIEEEELWKEADLFFFALPHGVSQRWIPRFYERGRYIIDLSADYRLKDPETYRAWYQTEHTSEELLEHAVYGLPELYRDRIRGTRLVANPGCYPTGALLGMYPLLRAGVVDTGEIIIDSKSGVSGAGRRGDVSFSYCEVNEAFRAYGVTTHRHTPEIEERLSEMVGTEVKVEFTPHLIPLNRGILTTVYLKLRKALSTDDVIDMFRDAYDKEPFIRLHEDGVMPDVKNVRGTNFCDIGLKVNERTGRVIVVTAIDNLMKGASGQAVQNMNVMMNFDERAGLELYTPYP